MQHNPCRLNISVILAIATVCTAGCSPQASTEPPPPYPEKDGVYLVTPRDGDTVSSPVSIRFGLKGRGVAPAGVDKENTGHHHLLVDVATFPPMSLPIPADENHIHFGGGQTETTIELAPGRHTLQLLLGDYLHVQHNPPWVSEKITMTVK